MAEAFIRSQRATHAFREPFILACEGDDGAAVTQLLATLTSTLLQNVLQLVHQALANAAAAGSLSVLRALVASDKVCLAWSRSQPWKHAGAPSPLYAACHEGQVECARIILATQRVDANLGCLNGESPLHAAAGGGHHACIKLLVAARGIDVNRINSMPNQGTHDSCQPMAHVWHGAACAS